MRDYDEIPDEYRDYCDEKKFVAFLEERDEEWDDDEYSIINLVDAKYYNDNPGYIPDSPIYLEEVYEAIEDLGCSLADSNIFEVDKKIKNKNELAEFLKPLPWIKAISGKEKHIDSSKIAEFEPIDNENDL